MLPPLPNQESFRIVTIQQGQMHARDQIICTREVASLSTKEDVSVSSTYDAVSYAFGTDLPNVEVIVDGVSVKIRETLWACLNQVRDPQRPTRLWVDVLCIDQLNESELSSQIQRMDRIYHRARRVLVWLGVESHNSVTAMKMIRKADTALTTSLTRTDPEYEALLDWFRRLYWHRTWVVQEFLLAKDLRLLCGNESLSWSILEKFLLQIDSESVRRNSNDWISFKETPGYPLIRQRLEQHNPRDLLVNLLVKNQTTLCSNPRDKVFAMLGLAKDFAPGSEITVSYKMNRQLLLLQVLQHCSIVPKHLVRWARFLMRILGLQGPNVLNEAIADPAIAPAVLNIRGYCTGRIINYALLNAELQPVHPQLLETIADKEFREACSDVVKMHRDEVKRLMLTMTALRAATPSDLADERIRKGEANSETQSMFIAQVYTSDCAERQVRVAVGCGDPTVSADVVQFFGNEIAIFSNSGVPLSRLAACLLFVQDANVTSDGIAQDPVTKNPCKSFCIQSEVNCVDSVKEFDASANLEQILALCQ